jgi:hypothetical protein
MQQIDDLFCSEITTSSEGKFLKGFPEIIAVSKGDDHEKQLSYESNPVLIFPYCSERGLLFSAYSERKCFFFSQNLSDFDQGG